MINLQFINDNLKKIGINVVVTKVSKLLRLKKFKDSDIVIAMYYIHVDNQNEALTQIFRLKYPYIINYNNCLLQLITGELAIEFLF